MKRFLLSFELDVVLRENEIWPDGSPAVADKEAVLQLIREEGGPVAVMNNWFLGVPDVTVTEIQV